MDLISRLLMEKKIGFEPTPIDVFTLDNCAICGASLEDTDVRKGRFICPKCNKTLEESPGFAVASD